MLAEHYAGDDTNVRTLLAGVLAAYAGISVEEFEAKSDAFLRTVQHPTLGRPYLACAYAPMVELLGHLEANGFSNYIASGGGRDFMRPISQEVYGVPRERVIGSATALAYASDDRGGTITRKAEADYLDDGPQKPIRIWSRTGRRPLLAAGNSNGDIPTTRPARSRRSRRPAATAGRSSASGTTGPRCSVVQIAKGWRGEDRRVGRGPAREPAERLQAPRLRRGHLMRFRSPGRPHDAGGRVRPRR